MKKVFTAIICIYLLSVFSSHALTLNEAVQLALRNSVEIQAAQFKKEIAYIQHNNALLGMLPDVTVSYNYSLNDAGYWTPDEKKNTSYSIEQPIFYNGRELFAFLAAYYSWKKTDNDAEIQKKKTIIDTITFYLELLKKRELMTVWDLEMQSSAAQLQKYSKLFELKQAAKAELYESESYYKNAKYNYTKAKNEYELDKMNFEHYLNTSFETLDDFNFDTLTVSDPGLSYYLKYALEHSIEYQNLKYDEKATNYQKKVNQTANWPQVSFFIQNSFQDSKQLLYGVNVNISGWFYSSVSNKYNFQRDANYIKVNQENYAFNASILTGDSITPQLLQSKISNLQAEYELRDRKAALERMIKKAYFAFEQSRDFYDMTDSDQRAKQEKFIRREKEFTLGLTDTVEKFKTQREYAEAKINYLNGKYTYYMTWFYLRMLVGEEVQFN